MPVRNLGAGIPSRPDIYIDRGACVPVCPVTAIFAQDDLPEKWSSFIEINKNYVDDGNFEPDKLPGLVSSFFIFSEGAAKSMDGSLYIRRLTRRATFRL
jgi:hypothetical protein